MKKWYLSKTLWFNILSILILIAQYCGDSRIVSLEVQTLAISIINILLRVITTQAIESKNKLSREEIEHGTINDKTNCENQ